MKRVALKWILATRFRFCFMHVFFAKSLHTFARHALAGDAALPLASEFLHAQSKLTPVKQTNRPDLILLLCKSTGDIPS
ncbi:hypothetical protein [Mesorhizobium sp. B3-1-6]|uniref:hypothetical protein n=1 Tax=Mesorhizobium sp. B3-1-6 TaxID=2589895 RepID=UPI0015E40F6A|nr:hypothetical protein [Mesorhizobium sp. B3-1-6]